MSMQSTDRTVQERFIRNASIVSQDAINQFPVSIIGTGAIGSHLAEALCKLGVERFNLIDPDEVDDVNLSVQGFHESEIGQDKVAAVANRLLSVRGDIKVNVIPAEYHLDMIPKNAAVFSCVDSMKVRRKIFRDFQDAGLPVFFDGRMSAESLRVFCISPEESQVNLYLDSLHSSSESYRESCTAKATIYCASIAAGILCRMYKRWAMKQYVEPHLMLDLFTMDCFE